MFFADYELKQAARISSIPTTSVILNDRNWENAACMQ
jgi:hypothetical protein